MIGIILAAGDGTRLKNSIDEFCCKPLIKVNKKSLIEYSLDNLANLGISEAYIVIGKEGSLIKTTLGDKYKKINIQYVYQSKQQGLINAFAQALKFIDESESVVLQLSDELFVNFKTETVKSIIESGDSDFYCGVTYEENAQKIKNNFSVEFDESLKLLTCIEKPTEIKNNVKGTGFCIFGKNALDTLRKTYDESTDTPKDLCDYMRIMIAKNLLGSILFIADREFNINTASDLDDYKSTCSYTV